MQKSLNPFKFLPLRSPEVCKSPMFPSRLVPTLRCFSQPLFRNVCSRHSWRKEEKKEDEKIRMKKGEEKKHEEMAEKVWTEKRRRRRRSRRTTRTSRPQE